MPCVDSFGVARLRLVAAEIRAERGAYRAAATMLLVALAAGWLLTSATRFFAVETEARLALVLAVIGLFLAVVQVALYRLSGRDWLHPLVFPVFYMTVVFIAPVLWVLGTGRSLGYIDHRSVSLRLLVVLLTTVVTFALGAVLASRGRPSAAAPTSGTHYLRMRRIGRTLLVVVTLTRLIRVPLLLSVPYGAGQLEYDLNTWLNVVEGGLVFLGVIFTAIANTQLYRKVFRRFDLGLFGLFAVLSLVTGSRGELVAPILFAAWARHSYVKPLRLRQILPVVALVFLLFQAVVLYRSEYRAGLPVSTSQPVSWIEGMLRSIGTPVEITGTIVNTVPSQHPFVHGRTYLEAVVRQLPGPASRALFGPPTGTGTFVYRDILGIQTADAGFGFALPAEAYLNFGLPGVAGAGLLVGLAFGFAYRRQAPIPSRAVHLLYPVLLATLPLALRSDALFQIKLVLYPILALAVVYRLCRSPAYVSPSPPSASSLRPIARSRI
jgi:oligosaccharide repeat unit polymerase